ncbi:MAG: phytoene/squalene synthase family protein [Desulfobacterales bacterium]|nr:MAG: phytoene/squalene synthase family protein [Desulfobacterales bacterium]
MTRLSCARPNEDFEQHILQGVSRSFALTIPQLPAGLRRPVTIAYLLCRIVDTIEDEETLSIAQKRLLFHEFREVVAGKLAPHGFADRFYPLLSGRTLPAEKELICNTPAVMQTFFSFNVTQQAVLRRCVTVMSTGMLKFQEIKGRHGLQNLSQLNNYCYHVAGVVGEMLTDLFCEYSEEIANNREKLFGLAASFGQGLQMTNILKDLWDDRERGACWLPQDLFREAGFDLRNLTAGQHIPTFGEGLAALIGIARVHLRNALTYTLIIPRHEAGIRKFCLWAIGMAVLTLRNINQKRDYQSGREVKISKARAKTVILVSNAALRCNFVLKALFKLAARGLPAASPLTISLRPAAGPVSDDRPLKYQSTLD